MTQCSYCGQWCDEPFMTYSQDRPMCQNCLNEVAHEEEDFEPPEYGGLHDESRDHGT
jgi:hypothetical protein